MGMRMIYIAICEDNEKTAKELEQKVKGYLNSDKIIFELNVYTNSMTLQYDIQEGRYFDIILSDIEMPDVNGMKLASYIKNYLPNAFVIFITSHVKYALDAFELSIFRYIPKSAIDVRLPQALKDAIQMINYQAEHYYYIQTPTKMRKILYQNILYIQRQGKNSEITLINDEIVKVRKSLAVVFNELNPGFFVYVDRGTIVNLTHILSVGDGIVELKNGVFLQASQAKLEQIKSMLSVFWSSQM